jgi:hypothetical protein
MLKTQSLKDSIRFLRIYASCLPIMAGPVEHLNELEILTI